MYAYAEERPWTMTDDGSRVVAEAQEQARRMLARTGAFQAVALLNRISAGDSFKALAVLDRLVEIGAIKEATSANMSLATQSRVYVAGRLLQEAP